MRGLSGHQLVPQSEAETEVRRALHRCAASVVPLRVTRELGVCYAQAAAFAESRHEIMAGVMAANQMYTEMLLAQDDAPVIETMTRAIEQVRHPPTHTRTRRC